MIAGLVVGGVKLDKDKTKESETYLFSLLMIEESYMQRK